MRPFLQLSTEELVKAARSSWDDPQRLQEILDETTRRKSKVAGALGRDLRKRISALRSAGNRGRASSDDAHASQLRHDLLRAEARVAELEAQLARREPTSESPVTQILSKWGLTESCPPSVFESAKRAWRKDLHPDSHPDKTAAERKALEKRFQDLEIDLSKLAAMGWPET